MKKLLPLAIVLAGCGSVATATAPTDAPTAATAAPVAPPTYHVLCSFVMTIAGSEIGINVDEQNQPADSSTECAMASAAFGSVKAQGANVTELDGHTVPYVGGDISVACTNTGITVYQHDSDPLSVTMASTFCTGMAHSTTSL